MRIENLRETVEPVFEGSDVICAYFHGSYAGGEEHGKSDLDIAVLSEEWFNLKESEASWESLGADRCGSGCCITE